MEMPAELLGIEESMKNLSKLIKVQKKAAEDALEHLLRSMCIYAKSEEGGNYIDHTSNLRNSVSVNINTMKEYPADTDPAVLMELVSQNETPVIKIKGDEYFGVISVGMEYAIWVELTSGYRVLQGTIDKFEPLIERYLADKLSVKKLNLKQIASIKYQK